LVIGFCCMPKIQLWLGKEDSKLFKRLCKAPLRKHLEGIVTAQIQEPGFLANMGRNFVLGKKGLWVSKNVLQKRSFVYIKSNSAYPDGLVLTPYSGIDVKFHSKGRTIDEHTPIQRVELMGSGNDDFIKRVFLTYYDGTVRRLNERDFHLLVYSTKETI
jgi:hypothetical protein